MSRRIGLQADADGAVPPVGLGVRVLAPLLAPEAEVMLYRVTQELTNNALKHARASRVLVDLRRTDAAIELVVSDNGRGFDPAAVRGDDNPGKGLGLDSVHERVAMLNGEVRIESAPGQGARFLVRILLTETTRQRSPAHSANGGRE